MKKLGNALIILSILYSAQIWAFTPFIVKDIRVEGLQRISAGTVFTYLPVKVNEKFDDERSAQAIKALFKTGFFNDIKLKRDGNVLVVIVEERPSIAKIDITGNKDIDTADLKKGLKKIGLAEGRVFNRSLLDKVEQELQRQYYSSGKYAVKIKTTVSPLERNRVAISLEISEGKVAKIKEINIVGNKVFSNKELLKQFTLSTPTMFSFYTNNDQYSKQKLSADLETLRSYYLDRGYLNFSINSTQVSISPDKKSIYITINIKEGQKYTIKEVKLAGRLLFLKDLEKQIRVIPGSTFSQKAITDSTTRLSKFFGKKGYAFANINAVPDVDKKTKTATITFFVDPGKRVYVRRINIKGNIKTADIVIRREIRLMEGAWFSADKVNRSKVRLDRLGYFESVNVETPPVPGTPDQVDVNFTVVEKPSGNFLASVGYSQTGGVIFSTSIQQDNFMGTGKRVGFGVNNSDINRGFNINYLNPYYTVDGISRGFAFSSQKTDASAANLSEYYTDVDQLSMNYGIPLSETNTLRFSTAYSRTHLRTTDLSSIQVVNFATKYGNKYDAITLGIGWSYDSRNKAIFADRGVLHSISAEVAIPGGDLTYYKASYKQKRYIPMTKNTTLLLKGEISYGLGYGDTGALPFFENFYAGGTRSVRGYKDNSLGPKDSNLQPIGGNFRTVGGAELIFPVPFAQDVKSMRTSVFFDVGNVFAGRRKFALGELRASAGLSLIWLSPVGPLSFSLAKPINSQSKDETQVFQFSLGGSFY